MIRGPKPICRHPLEFTVTITLRWYVMLSSHLFNLLNFHNTIHRNVFNNIIYCLLFIQLYGIVLYCLLIMYWTVQYCTVESIAYTAVYLLAKLDWLG